MMLRPHPRSGADSIEELRVAMVSDKAPSFAARHTDIAPSCRARGKVEFAHARLNFADGAAAGRCRRAGILRF
jgi:hypothetical protein